ncbi:MAG: DUF2142 domain-containing protein [Chloroflexi bacterium]|nr:DUF2142 domain-containing protein [Chloroflexota bacterium]MBT4304957.1 DUF2142 domain-containing protein [Chloroflexota bacterium]MBT4533280.1 DUF2142 domain-containing protein [Chloroflexota bacterium]MBT4683664.1 DUF2142 domain-containing protein [Chloroflexota bacterium]MBT6357938.1 DUF2142 domain-containing protein [Chloroflexota bacterium]
MKTLNKISSLKPEVLFAILIIVFGMMSVFLVPVGGGFDEDTHLARIWEMSSGTLLPNQKLGINGFPSIFNELSYRQDFIIESVGSEYLEKYLEAKIDWGVMISHETRSIYFPTLYLVQAFIMGLLGTLFDTPVLIIYFSLRISYLLVYAFLTFLAIKTIPFGKWLLTLLVLSPMAITQASIISPDAITHGMSFLFLAWVLKLSREGEERLNKKGIIILITLIVLLFTLKINSSALILLVFLIPPSKFGSMRNYFFAILGIVLIFIVVVLGWSYLTSSELTTSGNDAGIVLDQAEFIIRHPGEYTKIMVDNFSQRFEQYYKEWVGVFGYWYWVMPPVVYILFFVLLVLAIAADVPDESIGVRERIILATTFVAGYVLTVTLLYLKDNSLGTQSIGGVQGRYFIPMMPLLLLALSSKKFISINNFKRIFIPGIFLMLMIFGAGMYLSYHVNCGTNYYTSGYCYKPNYKNWDASPSFTEEITSEITLEQEIYVRCNNMEELRVWMKPSANLSGTTSFILLDAKTERIIFDINIDNDSIPYNNWMTINFPIEDNSINHGYKFSIFSETAEKENAAFVGVSAREEYWDGKLLINGVPQNHDVLFQYGCEINVFED